MFKYRTVLYAVPTDVECYGISFLKLGNCHEAVFPQLDNFHNYQYCSGSY